MSTNQQRRPFRIIEPVPELKALQALEKELLPTIEHYPIQVSVIEPVGKRGSFAVMLVAERDEDLVEIGTFHCDTVEQLTKRVKKYYYALYGVRL